MQRVFVDTDIILDLLAERNPHYIYSAILFSLADQDKLKLTVSPLSFAILSYILSRQYKGDQTRKKLLTLKTLVSILNLNEKIIDLALNSEFKDFEDGVQYFTAIENNIQTLLTRNVRDYRKAEIAVMTAEEFIKSR